jgi:2-amino-4-hydroxy-6-hydroxymethyldihydropteridine diphosphokinase
MAQVYLGVGSNIERERYITAGLDALQALFGELAISTIYNSESIGYEGPAFLNLVVGLQTDLGVAELFRQLRHIEYEHGRGQHTECNTPRQLDIDILLYDDLTGSIEGVELPRGEILYNAFVLRPLAELVPTLLHPLAGRSYAQLWRDFGRHQQALEPVDFSWRGRQISSAG